MSQEPPPRRYDPLIGNEWRHLLGDFYERQPQEIKDFLLDMTAEVSELRAMLEARIALTPDGYEPLSPGKLRSSYGASLGLDFGPSDLN